MNEKYIVLLRRNTIVGLSNLVVDEIKKKSGTLKRDTTVQCKLNDLTPTLKSISRLHAIVSPAVFSFNL